MSTTTTLPVSGPEATRHEALALLRLQPWRLTAVLASTAFSAAAGTARPALLGRLIDQVGAGTLTHRSAATTAGLLAASLLVQAALLFTARRQAFILSEFIFASIRDRFMTAATSLPLSTVERAGTGDLISRTTDDVEALTYAIRNGVPEVLVAVVTAVVTLAALIAASPVASLGMLIVLPLMLIPTARYLRRARTVYLGIQAQTALVVGDAAQTAEAHDTVAGMRLHRQRRATVEGHISGTWRLELTAIGLRMRWLPFMEVSQGVAAATVAAIGGVLVHADPTRLGAATAAVLYAHAMVDPLLELAWWIDELQVGGAALSRISGIFDVPDDRTASGKTPRDEQITLQGVSFAYRVGHDVLHDIDLRLVPGERLAIVGPSGAGKSTLGRILAGIHPPSAGIAAVGGVPLVDLDLRELRGHVALVTQEQHVFVGTIAENLRLGAPEATDDDLDAAAQAVDALGWISALPSGRETVVGSGSLQLTPAQAQQLALARLVLADPHTLVLDEATSLLDPRAARLLERSLSGVLTGRTVVAVAHRLHTAHDADRVAVVEGGRITELGTHEELMALGASYAALWEAWRA